MHIAPELVEAAKRGDTGAFEAIVRETHRAVYALVFRLVGSHEDAADVTQEAYLRAWRSLKGFRGDANLATWLYRVATNAALTHLKRRDVRVEPVEPEVLERLGPYAADETAQLEAGEIERALGRLPTSQRAVIVLKDVFGWSCAEIAEEMGATEGAVKVRLFRARQKLAAELARSDVVVPLSRRRKRAT